VDLNDSPESRNAPQVDLAESTRATPFVASYEELDD
jgi:hypothetical protein